MRKRECGGIDCLERRGAEGAPLARDALVVIGQKHVGPRYVAALLTDSCAHPDDIVDQRSIQFTALGESAQHPLRELHGADSCSDPSGRPRSRGVQHGRK